MILVTGGAGFIGSVLVSELNRLGREDIVIVDRLGKSEKWRNLRELKFYEYFVAEDFFHSGHVEELYDELDFIFHMGACSSTTEKNMDFLMSNNVDFSKNLMAYASEKQVPFIYASSAATYGDGEQGYDDNEQELPRLRALNSYGYSKQLVDEWVLKNSDKFPRWYGLKFFNVFGPNEYHKGEMRSLVHKAFGQIKETGRVKLFKSHREDFKDGEQLRDFIYVKDVVAAMIHLMQNEGVESGIYNMGTGQARSFKDLVEATFRSMNVQSSIEYIPMPEAIRDQYQYFTQANMKKFFNQCPDLKFQSLEEGVKDYVQNHLMKSSSYVKPGDV